MRIFHFGVALAASIVASSAVGWKLGWQAPPPGWHGKVAKIVRGGGGESLHGAGSLSEGAAIASGADVATDRKQRARIEMSDGSVLVLDRDTEIELDPSPATRIVHVKRGVVALDVAHVDGATPAKIVTERGEVIVVGTRLTVTATDDGTDVEVARGSVRAKAGGGREVEVAAGQEALLTASGVEVGPSAGRGGELLGERSTSAEDEPGAVGELRARRAGHADENDRALRVASAAVKIRIAGAMARTEIDETFANDTNDDLEGIYRFPVPAGALVDRLALEQDGKLVEGAFVEKTKAEKILKGAIATATPVQRFHDDIVWVPGPWRDPALLEWKQGGRFELRIFPIPKHGTRRIVLGYTQTVDASLGVRRYVYPLPSAGGVKMDDFSIDAQVLGADPAAGVRARGYDLSQSGDRLSFHEASFTPTGDLGIEYALPNRKSELTAWGFQSSSGERFVAMALRPRLPASAESRPRDWAVVVDSGRTMFGERFARASRVAVALAQTVDRRDRVTVLACDVDCRRNAGGFVPAGASGAKALADFLAPVVPDGASDLTSAVRRAAALGEAGRELRVVVVSDGRATAGYARPSRVVEEVADATPKDVAVLAVPVGSDADGEVLDAIAHGGGGVVVPYAPGERVSDVVVAVAGAGAGELLRAAKLDLPPGFETVAPSTLPTLRASGETYVVAKMTDSRARGDVVLRGKVDGEAFEARYPVDVTATTDDGNAFVPRLFAALRVRDLERENGDAARAEAVSLSQKLAVPSRFTSLLVLESDAMFRAFGIDRDANAPRWTGETLADATEASDVLGNVTSESGATDEAPIGGATSLLGNGRGSGGGGTGDGFGHGADIAAAPAATSAPAPHHPARIAAEKTSLDDFERTARGPWMRRRPGRFMRRVFHREATIAPTSGGVDASDGVTAARAALAAAPDDRKKHRDLARALLRRGSFDELEQVLADWQKRDPLDGDAIALRAELLASRGDRPAAARVLSGVAAGGDASRIDAVASGAERAGQDDLACALHVAAAESAPDDATRVARAVRCERARGRAGAADRWLVESGARRSAVEAALAAIDRPSSVSGDIVLDASWSGGGDLDLAVIDPSGQRLGWLAGRGRAEDTTSRSREKLAVASSAGGTFLVEIARADPAATDPATGFVNVTAFGMTKRVPFVLAAPSARVARIDARWVSELVPIDGFSAIDVTPTQRPFDVAAARNAVGLVPLAECSSATTDGIFGAGSADVTFSPAGSVSRVTLASPFATSRAGWCIRSRLFAARVAPFSGAPATVTRTFVVAP